ncbi:MAG: hypothetical protein HC825_08975 [Oscillatoriales cyanobacterium RM1_1_9]|nr:hypothetical protein [Oscillatoriales cyanobacterium RM1_1_9]
MALVMIILSAGGFFSHPDNQSLPEGSIPGNLTLETPTFETPTFEAPTFETPTSETSILKNSTPQNIQAQTEPNLAAGIAPTTLSPGQPLDSSVNGSINNSTDSELSSSQGSNSESNSTAILEPSTVEETSENQPTPNSVNSPEMNQSAELTPIPAELLAIAPPEAVQLSNPLILQPNLKQILLNSIQARITQKFRFAEPSLILAIQAKFIDSLLQVQLSAQWYQLRENQQDRLVQELWKQAKKSEFSKLAVTNSEDKLIARNPIIGSEMIILERQLNREFLTNNSP